MSLSENAEPPSIDLQFAAPDQYCPNEGQLLHWAKTGLQTEAAGLTIRIVDEQEIQALNSSYRSINKPTNVLSFAAEFPAQIDLPYLGDIAICASVVNTESREQNKTVDAHWAHMVIHGILHLRGYDHIDEPDARRMEQLETGLLETLGFANPYPDQPLHNRAGHV